MSDGYKLSVYYVDDDEFKGEREILSIKSHVDGFLCANPLFLRSLEIPVNISIETRHK